MLVCDSLFTDQQLSGQNSQAFKPKAQIYIGNSGTKVRNKGEKILNVFHVRRVNFENVVIVNTNCNS